MPTQAQVLLENPEDFPATSSPPKQEELLKDRTYRADKTQPRTRTVRDTVCSMEHFAF